jgi:hypothetical protein
MAFIIFSIQLLIWQNKLVFKYVTTYFLQKHEEKQMNVSSGYVAHTNTLLGSYSHY